MGERLFAMFCGSVIAFCLTGVSAQQASAQNNMAKHGRREGNVIRTSPVKSTLTVRKVGSNVEKIVHYDSATRWVSQETRVIARGLGTKAYFTQL